MATIGRRAYAEMFGPTVGDRVRLADTELVIEVEKDYTLAAAARPSATAWRRASAPAHKAWWTPC